MQRLNNLKNKDVDDSTAAFEDIVAFIDRYKCQKVFRFLRNNPPKLLHLDYALKEKAAREGITFDMPILGSSALLVGKK